MKVIDQLEKTQVRWRRPILAIGVFDGLHRGHQKLIQRIVRKAKAVGGTSLVMTFWPHPVHVLRPEVRLPLLVSLPHRLKLIELLGVDVCIVVNFTKSFSHLSPEKFVEQFLVKRIRPEEVFVGYDFRFGQNREGSFELFRQLGKKFGFRVKQLPAVKSREGVISSSRIRELISLGQLTQASRLLSRPVSVMGTVCRGDRRGKSLGFPTANLNPGSEVIPPCGVYVVRVFVGKRKFYGMANVGWRPSFKTEQHQINVEVHIFDFYKDIYHESILVEFLKKIRDEKIFNSRAQLIAQLKKDKATARRWLASRRPPKYS